MHVGLVGLGKMGANMRERLRRAGLEVTGYDRVMAYRFHEDAHGEVVAEARGDDQDSFLGLHYPAGDIPRPELRSRGGGHRSQAVLTGPSFVDSTNIDTILPFTQKNTR